MKSIAGTSTLAHTAFISVTQAHSLVVRIVASKTFQTAPTLQQLFRFLATRALEAPGDEIKEYTIGVEALGRKPDFDPKTDPIVRVQVYRLRQKLKEYYESEGDHESILVEIPKGHYLPRFEVTEPPASNLRPVQVPPRSGTEDGEAVTVRKPSQGFSGYKTTLMVLLTLCAFLTGLWAGHYRHPSRQEQHGLRTGQNGEQSTDPVKAFWAPFIAEDSSPIVAYADAIFLLDGSTDLFRYRHGASDNRGARVDPHLAREFASNPALVAKAGPLYFDNGYTGTGDVVAVAALTSLFTQMGARPMVESSYDITTNDLKQHNIILLGSSFQNVAVAQLPTLGDFRYVESNSVHDLWSGRILDSHPVGNERAEYRTERDPETGTLKADYALISFQPGIAPGRHIVNLGGLDTKGMEGAVLLATSKPGVEELAKALPGIGQQNQKIPSFQALLRVNLEKGYQVLDTQLLTVHPLSNVEPGLVQRAP
ncbi:MAG TPA: hypothetical protein VMB49_11665 [Acidobacteriaceae bacterium]|nr:hypothetical protein [Acidobacteriaceae bacterium]